MDNENNEELNEEFDESLERVDINNNNFDGYFHERDSLAENNIVEEVKTSFLENIIPRIFNECYCISCIT